MSITIAGLCAPAAAAVAGASAALQSVIDDHWQWWLSVHPVEATSLGVRRYDDQIPDLSLTAKDNAAAQARQLIGRLRSIDESTLSDDERVNKAVLDWTLSRDVEANGFGQRMMLFDTIDSWPQDFAGLAERLPFVGPADYESYLTRLSKYPQLNAQAMEITRRALKEGFIQPCSAIGGLGKAMGGAVDGRPEETRFYAPFFRAKPVALSDSQWNSLKQRAVAIVRDTLTPEYRRFQSWYLEEYLPSCRKDDGASTLPNGSAWYTSLAKSYTTTELTPAQIHKLGRDELERVGKRMDETAKQAGFASRQDFFLELKRNPKYYPKSAQELLSAAAWQAKQIDALMPRFFGTLARLPYGVRPVPAEIAESTALARYQEGSFESGNAGYFLINTSKLDQRALYELPALTAHEAVPGHHHQTSLAKELDLPQFRRFGGFAAFSEGWGLYTEFLGEEMGLYDTPEKMMGRLSYEAWRAARLIIDTGIHTMGWNKQRAVDFLKANTALTDGNIDAEVDRYITMPGQALAYKLGEIKIRELRSKAERALGPDFDVRKFHDAVLSRGSVPLTVLEDTMNRWIEAQHTKAVQTMKQ